MNPLLQIRDEIDVSLPSGRALSIARAKPQFRPWRGEPPVSGSGGKELLDYHGKPAFPELAVLWSLQEAGWEGVWFDADSGVFRAGFPDASPPQPLPLPASDLLRRIDALAVKRGGTWDVCCWRGEAVLFTAVKRSRRDRFSTSQLSWLEAAFLAGLTHDSFLVVEWDLEAESA